MTSLKLLIVVIFLMVCAPLVFLVDSNEGVFRANTNFLVSSIRLIINFVFLASTVFGNLLSRLSPGAPEELSFLIWITEFLWVYIIVCLGYSLVRFLKRKFVK